MSCRLKEQLGVVIMYLVTERYVHGGQPWSLDALAERLRLPADALEDLLLVLVANGLLVEIGDDPVTYLPAHDPESISLRELLAAVRSSEEAEFSIERAQVNIPVVQRIESDMDEARGKALGEMSVKELVQKTED